MKAKKRLEIVWETHEITTISFKGNYSARVFCQSCQSDAPHLTVSEAASVANISEAAVFRLAEAGEIHYLETEAGALLVCRNSFAALEKEI